MLSLLLLPVDAHHNKASRAGFAAGKNQAIFAPIIKFAGVLMSNPKILSIDDEPFNPDCLEQELEDLNCNTINAVNGLEAYVVR